MERDSAAAECEAMGAHLVKIEDSAENDWVLTRVLIQTGAATGIHRWIGLNRQDSVDWQWHDGTDASAYFPQSPASSGDWNDPSRQCIIHVANDSSGTVVPGDWVPKPCNDTHAYVCEADIDADADGVPAWQDCDDSDPQAWESASSLSFDGVDDYLELASTENAFFITDEFTLSAWIRWVAPVSGRSTVLDIERFGSNSLLSDNVGIELLVDAVGYLAMGFGDGATWPTGGQDYYTSAAALIPDQVWTHVAVTRSGSQISFYLDGLLTDNVSCHTANVDFSAGSSAREDDLTRVGMSYQLTFSGTENNVRFFDGDISEVGIWNRALAGPEVSALVLAQPTGSALTNLQGYWLVEAPDFVDATGTHGAALIDGPEVSTSCSPL
jgi:hypothetical protein